MTYPYKMNGTIDLERLNIHYYYFNEEGKGKHLI